MYALVESAVLGVQYAVADWPKRHCLGTSRHSGFGSLLHALLVSTHPSVTQKLPSSRKGLAFHWMRMWDVMRSPAATESRTVASIRTVLSTVEYGQLVPATCAITTWSRRNHSNLSNTAANRDIPIYFHTLQSLFEDFSIEISNIWGVVHQYHESNSEQGPDLQS